MQNYSGGAKIVRFVIAENAEMHAMDDVLSTYLTTFFFSLFIGQK